MEVQGTAGVEPIDDEYEGKGEAWLVISGLAEMVITSEGVTEVNTELDIKDRGVDRAEETGGAREPDSNDIGFQEEADGFKIESFLLVAGT